ncbi:hypothetical protein SAMN05444365_104460 [Micromonospora pattaloongensis]|uniref:Uncharacterized protein n=1 Tax=Micromonospora pattaloongensis TaxID=405436 RepID=A0A1H3PD15_9ACTN|nr:hypothetical protein [Micromonospora pattaloongensis]SDY98996.1 hypothetical protein SAMN05444365_104460 [Micromonospora pattaloongensis]
MTDTSPPDGVDDREAARRAAAAYTAAAREIEAFLRRVPPTPTAAEIVEFSNLIAIEEARRADREAALDALGLTMPSLDADD